MFPASAHRDVIDCGCRGTLTDDDSSIGAHAG